MKSLLQQIPVDTNNISLFIITLLSPSNTLLLPSSPALSMIYLNPAPVIPILTLTLTPVVQASPYILVPEAVGSLALTERTAFKLTK